MSTLHLTKAVISQLPLAKSGQVLVRDAQLTGFGVRIGTRSKTYFVEGTVDRRTVRTTIGRVDLVSLETARRKAVSMLGQIAEGVDLNRSNDGRGKEELTLAGAFDAFFSAKPNLSAHALSAYSRSVRLYLKEWSNRPIAGLGRQLVLAKHRAISEKHGNVTANNVMRHLRSVYNFSAAAYEDFPPNPVAILSQARAWHREQRRRSVIGAHQLPAWWSAVMGETEDARDVLLLALFTGMRRSEILSLAWERVDFDALTLTIPTTKNGDPLELPLSAFIADLLKARRDWTGQYRGWVFPSRSASGHIVETKSFTERVSSKSGVQFTAHDLRRTFVTIAESIDVPTYTLKRLLNHRTDGDVTGGYIIINAERLRTPVERVAQRILELANVR